MASELVNASVLSSVRNIVWLLRQGLHPLSRADGNAPAVARIVGGPFFRGVDDFARWLGGPRSAGALFEQLVGFCWMSGSRFTSRR